MSLLHRISPVARLPYRWQVASAGIAVCAFLIGLWLWAAQPHQWLIARQFAAEPRRALVAYHVIDGQPHVLFTVPRTPDTLFYDQLKLDWFDHDWPYLPRWQQSGEAQALPVTSAPASAAVAWCTEFDPSSCPAGDAVLFGQITDRRIAQVHALAADWRVETPVSAPGFIVQLHGVPRGPLNVVWLDANQRTLFTATTPGTLPVVSE